MSASSTYVPQHKVFINFRGSELRNNFLAHLNKTLKDAGINAFVDVDDGVGKDIVDLFKRIEESRIAVVIFSSRYTESKWCLNELVKMKEQALERNRLFIVPIFYKVEPETVKNLEGGFGERFWKLVSENDHVNVVREWKDALTFVTKKRGLAYDGKSDEVKFINTIVKKVKKALIEIPSDGRESVGVNPSEETVDKLMTPSRNISTGQAVKHEDDVVEELWNNGGNLGSRGPDAFPECRDVPEVNMDLADIPTKTSGENVLYGGTEESETTPLFGSEQRLKQLEEKLRFEHNVTRAVGVVGMPGIGKTTLVKTLFRKWEHKFPSRVFFRDIRRMSKDNGLHWLQMKLVQKLLNEDKRSIVYTENEHEHRKSDLLKRKAFIVLDDVDSEKQIESLLGELDWVKKGSKIVITTNDKSLIRNLVDDTYVVPSLTARDSFNCFICHAFGDHVSTPRDSFSVKLSRSFVDYAGGNPLALKVLGEELREKDETQWELGPNTLGHSLSERIQDAFRIRYDQLSPPQKEAFLDVACFFRSEDEPFVRSLVDSRGSESRSELRDLVDKFLVYISGGRVEMRDILFTFGKELASQNRHRLWKHGEVIGALNNITGTENVRGIYLDTAEAQEETQIDSDAFVNMRKLRYLKIYDSQCPQECEADCKIDFPDELKFPLDEVRYLHWMRFPLEELPQDFNPKSLIDLRLPYSKIQVVWRDAKEASKLKWIDLNHSDSLCNLSGLLGATSLQRLNLEGCTSLSNLPMDMQNMRSLVFLNLRGCTNLRVLKEMNLTSLKTLVLSDCSNLEEFRDISESLEALYLDGTAIKDLPPEIEKLRKLVILHLRSCKMLVHLPDCLGKLKALQELILSGCSKLESFPEVLENMKHLEILLLDGTAIEEMPETHSGSKNTTSNTSSPKIMPPRIRNNADNMTTTSSPETCLPRGVNRLSLLRHLCLSRNDVISRLPVNISELHHLKRLELKYCKNLTSLPMLPPNLLRLDAHGCDGLKSVSNPLSCLNLTEVSNCTFIFTECNNLEQDAKDTIACHAQWRSQLISDTLSRYDEGSISKAMLRTCFPGGDVPSWFVHQEVGSEITSKLPQHWCDKRLYGIALCAVVSFQEYQNQYKDIQVRCRCMFRNKDGSSIPFSSNVRGWSKPGKIESDHVFIGYTTFSQISKNHLEEQRSKSCVLTEAYLEFKGTNGAEVVKCGFSLMYAEPTNVAGAPNYYKSPTSGLSDKQFHAVVAVFLLVAFTPQLLLSIPWYYRVFAAFILCGYLVSNSASDS